MKKNKTGKNSSLDVIKKLLSYLLKYKLRMGIALLALILAKIANVGIPVVLKEIIDYLTVVGVSAIGRAEGFIASFNEMNNGRTRIVLFSQNNENIKLSSSEENLLHILISANNNAISREELSEKLEALENDSTK